MVLTERKPSEILPHLSSEGLPGFEGSYYFNARWYDAGTGRFITEDPVKDGLLWYAYVSNNPLKFIDPTGLREVRENPEADERRERERRRAIREISELEEAQKETSRDLSDTINEKKGEYNREYFDDSSLEDRIPGASTSTEFGEKFEFYDEDNDNFYGAVHGGVDKVGGLGQQEFSSAYLDLVYAEGDTVVYAVIGMDRFIGGKHLTADEVGRMNAMLGESFSPGDKLHKHPAEAVGDPSTGRHEHIFEYDSNGDFYDPDTHILPKNQPEQWRRESLGTNPFTGKPVPGGYIYEGASYRVPFLPTY